MSTRKSNTARLNTQPKLTDQEIKRIAEKLAVALEHDAEEIGLITLLFDHIQNTEPKWLWGTIYTIKNHLLVGSSAMDSTQRQFQADAYKNRGKLLLWPCEQKGEK